VATASPPPGSPTVAKAARVCGVAEWEMRAWWGRGGWGRNGDEWGAVVSKTWPSDAREMDGWEGVCFFQPRRTSAIEHYRNNIDMDTIHFSSPIGSARTSQITRLVNLTIYIVYRIGYVHI
jgi:hypothetical protein